MRASLAALVGCAMVALAPAVSAYKLHATYNADNWLDSFNFWTSGDPTHGFVDFVSADTAKSKGMLSFNSSSKQVYMGVDHTTYNPQNGRAAIRIQSKESFTTGLFILDLEHMPTQACGAWPAFWSCGPNWPNGGEIDVIEGVNTQDANAMTLHTSSGCSVNKDGADGSTQLLSPNCNDGGASNGCSERAADSATYGKGFNANGGGVYAYQWTNNAINIFHFPRNGIPADVTSASPKPSTWGAPLARFAGCDFAAHFYNHNIIFDTTFCGDWAGNVFTSDNHCMALAGDGATCNGYVAKNPQVFKEVYWNVNSLKVFKSTSDEAADAQHATKDASPEDAAALGAAKQQGEIMDA